MLKYFENKCPGFIKCIILCMMLAVFPSAGFTQTFTNSTPGNITDNTCFDRSFTVTALTVSDLNVSVNITHTWRGDLTLRLTSPATTQVIFFNRNGGSADNINAVFDDEATVTIGSDNANHTTQVIRIPAAALSAFDGQNASGPWTLQVCDLANADTGTFNSASLIFTAPASITVIKDAVPNNAQDFSFSATGPGLSAFSLDDDADSTLSNTRTFNNLASGSYSVTEAAVAGWVTTALVCVDPDSGTTVNLGTRVASIDVDSGENIICTYTNAKLPILRLQKSLPSGRFVATDQFALSITGSGGPASVTTTGAATTATGIAILSPGAIGAAYTLSETAASGANLANYASTYSCTNALSGGQTPSGSGTSFTINAVVGDDLTCTITNTRNSQADLRITKTNTPGVNGEVDQAADTLVSGAATTYILTVSNLGPDAANGSVLTDPASTGLTCTTASCASAGGANCPAQTGAALVSALQGAGATIPTLPNGGSVTVSLVCTVVATGL